MWYPPPGAMTTAAPVPLETRNGVNDGALTLVISKPV